MLIKKKVYTQKISDLNAASLGRSQQYWLKRGYINRLKGFRKPLINLASIVDIANLENSIIKKFNIRGLEFGNWLNAEDRYNYVSATVMAFYDLNKILGFNYNIGINKYLILSFGARGKGRALAHFEPWSNVINITRYDKETTAKTKNESFSVTGGVGSMAHEYGHFLDYFFGTYIDQSKSNKSLTLGDATTTKFMGNYIKNSYRSLMHNVIDSIVYKKPGVFSNYYLGLKKKFTQEYWFRHNELFARAFEQYISYKLENAGILNRFLAKGKYPPGTYMADGDLSRVIPHLDKLIKKMSADIKTL